MFGVRPHLVVVVDEVHGMTVAVGGATIPVVADIVPLPPLLLYDAETVYEYTA